MKLLTTTEIKKVSGAAGGFYEGSVSWQCAFNAGFLMISPFGGPWAIAGAAVGAATACLS
ncbi:hypothetical protein ACQE32_10340 [Pantoea sp. FN0302]|uniref:hypothetical protein n=1 Tax=unclassified Pantoea TaxID=2630326 RepID=UPI003CF9F9C3